MAGLLSKAPQLSKLDLCIHYELCGVSYLICIQVVACKNSLVALDEEALPVISKRKKAIADIVVKILSSYYKRKRIATKVRLLLLIKQSLPLYVCQLQGTLQAVCQESVCTLIGHKEFRVDRYMCIITCEHFSLIL